MSHTTHDDAAQTPVVDESLDYWIQELVHHLEIEGLQLDVEPVLELSAQASGTVSAAAGPATTFLVGYVAGLAEATGQAEFATAARAAQRVASSLLERRASAVG